MAEETRRERKTLDKLMNGAPRPMLTAVRDILFLLDAVGTIEHAQDRDKLATVCKRYGWKLEDRNT